MINTLLAAHGYNACTYRELLNRDLVAVHDALYPLPPTTPADRPAVTAATLYALLEVITGLDKLEALHSAARAWLVVDTESGYVAASCVSEAHALDWIRTRGHIKQRATPLL